MGIELHSEWNIFHNSEITPDKKIINLNVLSSRIPDFASYDIIFILFFIIKPIWKK